MGGTAFLLFDRSHIGYPRRQLIKSGTEDTSCV